MSSLMQEFLKAAIMQSDDSTVILCICHNFKSILVLHVFMSFLSNISAQNFQSEQFDYTREFAFRKSVTQEGLSSLENTRGRSKSWQKRQIWTGLLYKILPWNTPQFLAIFWLYRPQIVSLHYTFHGLFPYTTFC